MAKSIVSNYGIMPVFLLLVACEFKTNERDRHKKNDEPNLHYRPQLWLKLILKICYRL
jgi:hypothetical protein